MCIDHDNQELYEHIQEPDTWQVRVCTEGRGIGEILNAVYHEFPDEPWYGILGDDALPRTKDWDRIITEACLPDKLAFGNDLLKGSTLAPHPCVGGDMVRELGWLALPGCTRLYIDTALYDYASKTNRLVYLPDVIVEHMHFSNGKAAYDATYQKPMGYNDKRIYEQWLASLSAA